MQEMWEMQVQSLGQADPPRGGQGNPLQYSCLDNPMDRGAWWATVHRLWRVGHDWATDTWMYMVWTRNFVHLRSLHLYGRDDHSCCTDEKKLRLVEIHSLTDPGYPASDCLCRALPGFQDNCLYPHTLIHMASVPWFTNWTKDGWKKWNTIVCDFFFFFFFNELWLWNRKREGE